MQIQLKDVPLMGAFMIPGLDLVYEHRGNGWYQIYGKSYTGGPWHMSQECYVDYEPPVEHPSQQISCYV